jgi:cyclophilin family peptidyl-prolyl cis-trans isomerase
VILLTAQEPLKRLMGGVTAPPFIPPAQEPVTDMPAEAAVRRRVHWTGADVAVITAVLVVVLGTVLLEGRKAPAAPGPSPVARAQEAADAIAVHAGCPRQARVGVNTALAATPTPVLTPDTLYAARVATTAGTFTVVLYTGSVAAATNDFVYLAGQRSFHCVAFSPATHGGIVSAGDPGLAGDPGAGSLRAQVRVGSLVAAAGGPALTVAGRWFVVAGGKGTRVERHDVVFGRVTAGMGVVEKIEAAGSAREVSARVIHRILSVTIVDLKGTG